MDTSSTADRLKTIRGDRTQSDLAKVAGIHKNTLGRYERGEQEPDLDAARRICSAFGVEPRWLLFGEGPIYRDQQPAPQTIEANIYSSATSLSELDEVKQENRELRKENRDLHMENRALLKENGDLRVALAEIKARDAPREGLIDGQAGEAARKSA